MSVDQPLYYQEVVIPANQAFSSAVRAAGAKLVALVMPNGWTSNAAITVQSDANDDGNWRNVYNSAGIEVSIVMPAASAEVRDIPELDFGGEIRLRSGTASTPVNQIAARTIGVLFRTV